MRPLPDPSAPAPAHGSLVDSLLRSRSYGSVDPAVLDRVAREAAARHPREAEALKAAKRRLHQLYGAYWPGGRAPRSGRYDHWTAAIREAEDGEARRDALRRVLARHASTRERVDHLDRLEALWSELRRRVPPPHHVLDLACGLHPLCIPWMGLGPDVLYGAWDVDPPMLAFVSRVLDLLGVRHRVGVADLVEGPPQAEARLALLLKTLPCLERQRPGAGLRLVRACRAEWVLVSFPTLSIGRRDKGMRESYARDFESWLSQESLAAEAFEIPGELFYLVRR